MRKILPFIIAALLPLSSFALPSQIQAPGERMVLVSPRTAEWGAYTGDGRLIRSGIVSTGKAYCPDMHQACHTRTGDFRVFYIGGAGCVSDRFPVPRGGAPMPYCMYFSGDQAMHGSYELGAPHLSHGCVRMHVGDAAWLHNSFVNYGTLVRVLPY